MRNHEVTEYIQLLDGTGNLKEPGWARRQYWKYDRSGIRAPKYRIKEWDYYIVIHDGRYDGSRSFAAAFTLSDDGYVGLQSVSLLYLDEEDPHEHTETILNVFPMGKMHMPASIAEGDVIYRDKRLDLSFLKRDDERHIRCSFRDFEKGKDLKADIVLKQPDEDCMTITTPWDADRHFYYNTKVNCMPASGMVEYDGEILRFDPAHDFGTLDWGRGVWTYDNTWYWGNGNALVGGHRFGFNIGYGFGDTSAASENILFLDGKAHKLDDLSFGIPEDTDPKAMEGPEWMKEWHMTSSDGRFEMDFVPVLDRAAKLDFRLIVSDQHQVFGRMSGKAVLDDGTVLEIRDVLCFAEKVHNKY